MYILMISIIGFAIIMFIVNLIDKNKEKLIEKFKVETKEVMKCPVCYKEYEDLTLKDCSHCESYLEKHTKYNIPNELKKKIIYIIVGVITIVTIGIGLYFGITNYINEQKRIEKYNSDISICYEMIKNESNFNKFTLIIKEHTEETTFVTDAYSKLYQAIDERIENVKNANDDDKLVDMLEEIKKKDSNNLKIEDRYLKAKSYININKANKQIEEQKYKEAYELFGTVITANKDKNQDILEIATSKQSGIRDKAFEQIIAKAQEQINNKEYSSAQTTLLKYKDLGNQTILDMYNSATNEIKRIEAEEKAKEEAERKAKEEQEAREKAKKEAEEKARKKREGVRLGMSKQDVLDSSWGKPDHINKTTTRYGTHEQWVYGGGNYLYFEDGILTSIQN